MNTAAEKLFCAIGEVGDDLIERAKEPIKQSPHTRKKWLPLAACCALVIGAAALALPTLRAQTESAAEIPETASYAVTTESLPVEEAEADNAAPRAAEPATEESSMEDAICITVDEQSLTATAGRFTITNTLPQSLTLSGGYTIEQLVDGAWEPLTMRAKIAREHGLSITDSYVLEADWQALYGTLAPGEYRLCQPLALQDGTDCTVYACFTIN